MKPGMCTSSTIPTWAGDPVGHRQPTAIFYGGLIGFVGNKALDVGACLPAPSPQTPQEVFRKAQLVPSTGGRRRAVAYPPSDHPHGKHRVSRMWPPAICGDRSLLRTGYKRVGELCDKYGVETVKSSMARLLDQGEVWPGSVSKCPGEPGDGGIHG